MAVLPSDQMLRDSSHRRYSCGFASLFYSETARGFLSNTPAGRGVVDDSCGNIVPGDDWVR